LGARDLADSAGLFIEVISLKEESHGAVLHHAGEKKPSQEYMEWAKIFIPASRQRSAVRLQHRPSPTL
jgi:hypothetical protein